MKRIITILLLVFAFGLNAQNHKTHKVKEGETIKSIAKLYLVTPHDILALNPDAKTNFGNDTILIIPASKVKNEIVEPSKEIIDYKKHKVKRKETLFGLSQKYKVSQVEIKKANPRLYSETLRKGDRIRIPRYKTIVSKQTMSNTVKKYTVLPSEGKWRIAYKFGITVAELESLNPNMNEVIQPGEELNVPNIADNEEVATTENYNYYAVQPKEGFFRLKEKLGLTEEQLEELNPGVTKSGLKEGMVLKIPKDIDADFNSISESDNAIVDLSNNIKSVETKRIAVLLPFMLHKMDLDSVAEAKSIIKKDKTLNTALDFHSGVLMALDSARAIGLSTDLKVFDTENRATEIVNITSKEDFSKYDAVIGPMMAKTFDRFAEEISNSNVPIFAPLAKPSKVTSNVYQTLPEKSILMNKIINFVKVDTTKAQVIIISDQKHRQVSNKLKEHFPSALQLFSEVKEKKDNYFIHKASLMKKFKPGKNIVFLETDNVAFGTSAISLLNGFLTENIEIVLTTTDKSRAFESTEADNNYHLSNLKFHFPSINKNYDSDNENDFVKRYKSKYGVSPTKYATRGFDITLDVLLRLAASEEGLANIETGIETEYIENKFRYGKKIFGGHVNEAAYIVRYDNLKIVEVKE